MGLGAAQVTTPAFEVPRKAPLQLTFGSGVVLSSIPASESVTVLESTQSLLVEFEAPLDDHGSDLRSYEVEWWRAQDAGQSEVEIIKTEASSRMRGTFIVTFDGDSTDTLAYDTDEDDMEFALEALPKLRDVQVTRSQNESFGGSTLLLFTSPPSHSFHLSLTHTHTHVHTLNSLPLTHTSPHPPTHSLFVL